MTGRALGPHVLDLDLAAEVDRICGWMVDTVANRLKRRGVIIAMSGGIDSSVCAALAVRAFGAGKVYGILLPERDSSHKSADRGALVGDHLGVTYETFDIAPALAAIGCYRERDEAIRRVFPAYGEGWKCKLAIAGGAQGGINFFKIVVQSPDGATEEKRLALKEYLQVVAATNYKQRIRKTVEFVCSVPAAAIEGTEDKDITVPRRDGNVVLEGEFYLKHYVQPNFYFHVTTAYALLRHNGVELGKADYLGALK